MAQGQVHHPQCDEVGGHPAGDLHPVGRGERRSEEHVEDPDEQDHHRAVDLVRDDRSDRGADPDVDDGEHHRPGRDAERLVHCGAQEQRRQGRCGGQCGDQQAGRHSGDNEGWGGEARQDQTTVRRSRLANLEEHRQRRQERGGPAGGRGLDCPASAAQQFRGIGHRFRGHPHEHDRDQNQDHQVHRVAAVVQEESAGQHPDRGHFGVAFPSRSSMMRSNRASSAMK